MKQERHEQQRCGCDAQYSVLARACAKFREEIVGAEGLARCLKPGQGGRGVRAIECMAFTSARARDAAPEEQIAPFSAFLFIQFMRLRGVQSSATHVTCSRLLMHWLGGGGSPWRAQRCSCHHEQSRAYDRLRHEAIITHTSRVTHDVPPACSVARVAAKKRRCGA